MTPIAPPKIDRKATENGTEKTARLPETSRRRFRSVSGAKTVPKSTKNWPKSTPGAKNRFSQNRRVISKEVHYFDHPYMGMIVKIRRYKVPTREEETE